MSEGRACCHATPSAVTAGTPVIHTIGELFTESVDIRARGWGMKDLALVVAFSRQRPDYDGDASLRKDSWEASNR